MTRTRLFMGLVCLALVAACGSDSAGDGNDAAGPDGSAADAFVVDATIPDAGLPDAAVCSPPAFGAIGGPCDSDADCGSGGMCLDEDDNDGGPLNFPDSGFCTKPCTAPSDCATGSYCSDDIFAGGGPGAGPSLRLCVAECCSGDVCGAGYVCTDSIGGLFQLGSNACIPGDASAVDGDACASMADCNAASFCQSSPFHAPGGQCITIGCTVGDNDTCAPNGDGVCVDFGPVTACLDTCAQASDCRDAKGYVCANIGAPSSVCVFPSGDAGDACTVDLECGPAGSPWTCLTGAGFPQGYCTGINCDPTDPSTCPDDSFCISVGGGTPDYCVASCDPAGNDCRVGYTCVDQGGGASGCVD